MSNNNRRGPLLFHYRCDECSKRFSLRSDKIDKDPYPRDPEVPEKENMLLCVTCRRQLDQDLKQALDEIFLDDKS